MHDARWLSKFQPQTIEFGFRLKEGQAGKMLSAEAFRLSRSIVR
jgi:hypothetical protein